MHLKNHPQPLTSSLPCFPQKVRPELADNSYEATFGEQGWGARAAEKFKHTQGKSFRREKTKRKRGSYHGGRIDSNQVHSFKFEDD